eukprot:Platyproteum_vivax@DN6086_c0_g1_i1.p1
MGNLKSKTTVRARPAIADAVVEDLQSLTCSIRIIVLKGVNMPASDDTGTTDAYVVFTLVDVLNSALIKYHKRITDEFSKDVIRKVPKNFKKKTSVRPCTRNPEWNEIIAFEPVDNVANCVLHVKINDQNNFAEHVQLGYFQIPLLAFVPRTLWPIDYKKRYSIESLLPNLKGRDQNGVPLRWTLNTPKWGAGPGYDVSFTEIQIRVDLVDYNKSTFAKPVSNAAR